MRTTVNKCDRCKKAVDVLIDIQIVNRNVEEEKEEKEPDSLFTSMWGKSKSYPTITKEVCVECATDLCKWLDHSENLLIKSK